MSQIAIEPEEDKDLKDQINLARDRNLQPPTVDPNKLLFHASCFVVLLLLLFVAACYVHLSLPDSRAATDIFEQARADLPPLITLILGFYFGGRHSNTR